MSSIMKTSYQHKIPRLKTVNLELRDFSFYNKKDFDAKQLDFDFDFKITFEKPKTLQIFIHLQYAYLEKKTKKKESYFPIYHSDHTVRYEYVNASKIKGDFEIEYLAHLLGTSIIMVKGYYDNITRGFIINDYPLPIFNPLELIKVKYEDYIKDDLLQFPLEEK